MNRQCYELIGDGHRKFWSVEVHGLHYLATYGRIGTQGSTQVKTFSSAGQARDKALAMISEKTGNGYVRVNDTKHPGAPAALVASLSTPKAATPAPAPIAPVKKPQEPVAAFADRQRAISLD